MNHMKGSIFQILDHHLGWVARTNQLIILSVDGELGVDVARLQKGSSHELSLISSKHVRIVLLHLL